MSLPRLQLFEFNDAAFVPKSLQKTIISSLSRTLRWGHMLDGLVQPFVDFLHASKAHEVLEIAAGAGEPAAVLVEALLARGHQPPTFTLTDLLPHPESWSALSAKYPERISFIPEPVDATNIEPSLGAGRARVIVNAFHHFPPALAQQVLIGMAKDAPGVFISEGLVRNPLSFLAMVPWGIPSLMAEPALGSSRLSSAAWTWLSPIALLASGWDGTVSTFRCYSREEMLEFTKPLGDSVALGVRHLPRRLVWAGQLVLGVPVKS